jgi:hypothetical protein
MASDLTIAAGLLWAADHAAQVANVSFEMLGSSTVSTAAQYFQSNGGVVTFAAGNSGIFDYSDDDPYVLMVSATDQDDLVPDWSNIGNSIDLSAPGVSILTTVRSGGYGSGTGTSASAPIVASVAALVMSVNPSLTGVEVQDILKQSANDLGPSGWDPSYGWGRVNAASAVNMALEYSGTPDTEPPTSTVVEPVAGSLVSGTVDVLVEATDNVGVSYVDLFVNGTFVSSDSIPPHEWTWDTTPLPDGPCTISAVAYDAAGNTGESLPVQVTVDNTDPECITNADCSDGVYCNGTEICADGTCQGGTPVDCDDGIVCTADSCNEAAASCENAANHSACDDMLFCNGTELCDAQLGCQPGAEPCSGQLCDEASDSCVDCLFAADCDDGLFCNGAEQCVNGSCHTGTDPCPGEICEETGDVCVSIACDNDGTCELDEDCEDCPNDCFQAGGSACGNGACETADGEDCVSCPEDCNGVQTGAPSGRFCCGDGDGVNPVGCTDPRCTEGGASCSDIPTVASCCGDLVCTGTEDGFNCEVDCGPPLVCGDDTCDTGENNCTCPVDCGPPAEAELVMSTCSDGLDNDCDGVTDCEDTDCSGDPACPVCDNNDICEAGEDCRNCPKDCAGQPKGRRSAKFCCGNGILEEPEGNGDICDGNP